MTLEFKHNTTAQKALSKTTLGWLYFTFFNGRSKRCRNTNFKTQPQAMFSLSMEERK